MAPKVFISYAHESQKISDKVLNVSNLLREKGVDCEIDQYEESPPEGWPKWMMRQVQEANFVLVLCTELFFRRANDFSGNKEGLGVKWETNLILQQLYSLNTGNTKFIPVLVNSDGTNYIPLPLQPYTHYDLSKEADLAKLTDRLRGTSTSKRPPLGSSESENVGSLDAKERKSMFVSSIIDVDLWNEAKWNGMVFIGDRDRLRPPIVGFMFENPAFGDKIFTSLKKQFGEVDVGEEIRLSFIEEISKEDPGDYKVHLGSDWDAITRKMTKIGFDPMKTLFLGITRIHEMNPPKDSRNLSIFKSDYHYFGTYYITNIVTQNGQVVPRIENLIRKNKVHFRKKEDVIFNKNDPDIACFGENGET